MLGRKASYLFGRRSSKKSKISGLNISSPTPIHPININGSYVDLAPAGSPTEQDWAAAAIAKELGEHPKSALLRVPTQLEEHLQSLDIRLSAPGAPTRSGRASADETRRDAAARGPGARSFNFSRPSVVQDGPQGDESPILSPAEVRRLRRVSSVPSQETRPLSAASGASRPGSGGGPAASAHLSRSFSLSEVRPAAALRRRASGSSVASSQQSRPAPRSPPARRIQKEPVSPLTPPRALRASPFPFSSPEADVSDIDVSDTDDDGNDAPLPPEPIAHLSKLSRRISEGGTLSPLDLQLDKIGREALDLAHLLSPKDFPLPASPSPSSSQTVNSIDMLSSGTPTSPVAVVHSEHNLPAYLGKMEDVRPEKQDGRPGEEEVKLVRSLSRKMSRKMKRAMSKGEKDGPKRRPSQLKQHISKPIPVSKDEAGRERETGQEPRGRAGCERNCSHSHAHPHPHHPPRQQIPRSTGGQDAVNKVSNWNYDLSATAGPLYSHHGYPTPDPSSSRSSVRSSDRNPTPETPLTPHEDYGFDAEYRPAKGPRLPLQLGEGRSDSTLRPWAHEHQLSSTSREVTLFMDAGDVPEVTREPPTPDASRTRFENSHRDPRSAPRSQRRPSPPRSGKNPIGLSSPGFQQPPRTPSVTSSRSNHSAHAAGTPDQRSRSPSVASSKHSVQSKNTNSSPSSTEDGLSKSPTELSAPPNRGPALSVRISTASNHSTLTTASVRSNAPFGSGPKLLRMRTMSSRAAPLRQNTQESLPPSPLFAHSPSVRTFGSAGDRPDTAHSLRPGTAMSFATNDEGFYSTPGADSTRPSTPGSSRVSSPEPSPTPFGGASRSLACSPEPMASPISSASPKPSLRLAKSFATLRAPSMCRPSSRASTASRTPSERPSTSHSMRSRLTLNTAFNASSTGLSSSSRPTTPSGHERDTSSSPTPSAVPSVPSTPGGMDDAQKERAMNTIRRAFTRRQKRTPSRAIPEGDEPTSATTATAAPPIPAVPAVPADRRMSQHHGGALTGKSELSMNRWMLAVSAAREKQAAAEAAAAPPIPNIPTPEQAGGDYEHETAGTAAAAGAGGDGAGAGGVPQVLKLSPEERAAVARLPGSIFLKTRDETAEGGEKQHRLKPRKGDVNTGACVFCGRGPLANMWCCLDDGCAFTCCRVCAGEKVNEGVAELF